MIAHRLTTIETADYLLFFKNRNELQTVKKGSIEFIQILNKLRAETMPDSSSSGTSTPDSNDSNSKK
jgi:hypothetical protein